MDWILLGLILVGYFVIAGLSITFFTKALYKSYLSNNKNPVPTVSRGFRKYTVEEVEKLETERRTKLAAEALKGGLACGFAWFITIPSMLLLFLCMFVLLGIKKLAIDPADKEFVTAKEYRKAEEIVAKWNMQEADKFEKELNV